MDPNEYPGLPEDWYVCNRQGFIPFEGESESQFIRRIEYCLLLRDQLESIEGVSLPEENLMMETSEIFDQALEITEKCYGLVPTWIPILFSNHQLAAWHGGCAWIFQLTDEAPIGAFLQLRSKFERSSTYLKIYRRDELVAHEISHVGRMGYEEPHFEEFLAYRCASSGFRRWIGPIVQSSTETLLWIVLLMMTFIALLAATSFGYEGLVSFVWSPLVVFLFSLIRLIRRHYVLNKAEKHLREVVLNPNFSSHLLYRLKDEEIELFAHLEPKKIRKFIEEEAKKSFRWRFLSYNYPLQES